MRTTHRLNVPETTHIVLKRGNPKRKPHQDNGDSDKRRRQEEALDAALKIPPMGVMDLNDALPRGMPHFSAMPPHALFLSLTDFGASRRRQSRAHGGLGIDRRRPPSGRLLAVVRRPRRGGAGARSLDLALVSQSRGGGPERSPRTPTSAQKSAPALCRTISSLPLRRRGAAKATTA